MTSSTQRVPRDEPGPSTIPPRGSRIQLDSSLRRWFSRNLGLWRSRRLYFFRGEEEGLRLDSFLRIESRPRRFSVFQALIPIHGRYGSECPFVKARSGLESSAPTTPER